MATPIDIHKLSLKSLLRYSKVTMSYGLTFTKLGGLELVVYYDVDYASYPNDKHSICVFRVFSILTILKIESNIK